ncbi:MAG: M23 family metallopeptidase [Actinobacteria bacterium]|nr:M23 family metallopeptidase [Actinomycetota bacterium]
MLKDIKIISGKFLLKIKCIIFLIIKFVSDLIITRRHFYYHIILLIIFGLMYCIIFMLLPSPIFSSQKAPFIFPLDGEFIVKFRESYWDEACRVERKHTGVDISGENGDKVIASGSGIVSYIGFSPIGGRTIVIKHNEKIRTTYLNLLQIHIPLGTQIKQGDTIAVIGADDDPSSKMPHLHFGIIYDCKYLDPEDVLNIDYSSISKFIYLKYLKPDFKVELN